MNKLSYRPPSDLTALGRVLDASEMPPLLFRFPGPCGLFDLSHGLMHRLAPPELSYTYFGAYEHQEFSPGIRCFGSLAVFAPETFHVVRLEEDEVLTALGFSAENRGHVFLGVNRTVSESDFAWVPSQTYFSDPELHSCRTPADIRGIVGADYDELREGMFTFVRRYMEEMSEVLRRDISRPPGSWYAVPPEERKRLMAEKGLEPIWT